MSKKTSRRQRNKVNSTNGTFCVDYDKKVIKLPEKDPTSNSISCVDSITNFFFLGPDYKPDRNKPVPAKTYLVPKYGTRDKNYAIHFIDVGYWWYRRWSDLDIRWFYYREHGVLILPAKEGLLKPHIERIAPGQSLEDFALGTKSSKSVNRDFLNKKISGQLRRKVYQMAFDANGNLKVADPGKESDYTEVVIARRFIFPMWHIHMPQSEKCRNKNTIHVRFNPNYSRLMRFYLNRYDDKKYETLVNPAYNAVMQGLLGDKIRDFEMQISEFGSKHNSGQPIKNKMGEQSLSMMLVNRRYMVWITEVYSHPHKKNAYLQFSWKSGKRTMYGSTPFLAEYATDLSAEKYILEHVLDENNPRYVFN